MSKLNIKKLEQAVIRAAKQWHLIAPVDYCKRKCTKHAGVCELGKAVERLLAAEKEGKCSAK